MNLLAALQKLAKQKAELAAAVAKKGREAEAEDEVRRKEMEGKKAAVAAEARRLEGEYGRWKTKVAKVREAKRTMDLQQEEVATRLKDTEQLLEEERGKLKQAQERRAANLAAGEAAAKQGEAAQAKWLEDLAKECEAVQVAIANAEASGAKKDEP